MGNQHRAPAGVLVDVRRPLVLVLLASTVLVSSDDAPSPTPAAAHDLFTRARDTPGHLHGDTHPSVLVKFGQSPLAWYVSGGVDMYSLAFGAVGALPGYAYSVDVQILVPDTNVADGFRLDSAATVDVVMPDDSDIVKIAMPASMPHAPQHTVRVHVWDPLPGLPEQQALLASRTSELTAAAASSHDVDTSLSSATVFGSGLQHRRDGVFQPMSQQQRAAGAGASLDCVATTATCVSNGHIPGRKIRAETGTWEWYDAFGALSQISCFLRAEQFWEWCSNPPHVPVTMTWVPSNESVSYPQQPPRKLAAPGRWKTVHLWVEGSEYGGEGGGTFRKTWHGMLLQDKIVARVFGGKRGGFFIDLAAADAVGESNSIVLEQDYGWNGLCVEARASMMWGLAHRKCTVIQAVVGGQTGEEVTFNFHGGGTGGWTSGIVGPSMFNKAASGPDTTQRLRTVAIDTVLAHFEVPRVIDYFSLDVEGAEEGVILRFPWQQYTVLCMSIERPSSRVREILRRNGLVFLLRNPPGVGGYDEIFIHESIPGFDSIRIELGEDEPWHTEYD